MRNNPASSCSPVRSGLPSGRRLIRQARLLSPLPGGRWENSQDTAAGYTCSGAGIAVGSCVSRDISRQAEERRFLVKPRSDQPMERVSP
jgi:hypothetical protein